MNGLDYELTGTGDEKTRYDGLSIFTNFSRSMKNYNVEFDNWALFSHKRRCTVQIIH